MLLFCKKMWREEASLQGRLNKKREEDQQMQVGSSFQSLVALTEKALSPMHKRLGRKRHFGWENEIKLEES